MTITLSLFYLVLLMLVLWALWKSGTKSLLFWIIVPIFVFVLGYSWVIFDGLRGWAYAKYPENESEFHSALIDKPHIYILVQEKGSDEPRLHVIPYTEENERKISGAQRAKQNGQTVVTNNDNDGELQFYNFDMQKIWKK